MTFPDLPGVVVRLVQGRAAAGEAFLGLPVKGQSQLVLQGQRPVLDVDLAQPTLQARVGRAGAPPRSAGAPPGPPVRPRPRQ